MLYRPSYMCMGCVLLNISYRYAPFDLLIGFVLSVVPRLYMKLNEKGRKSLWHYRLPLILFFERIFSS